MQSASCIDSHVSVREELAVARNLVSGVVQNVLVCNTPILISSLIAKDVLVASFALRDGRVACVNHALALFGVLAPKAKNDCGTEADEKHEHGEDVPPVLDILKAIRINDFYSLWFVLNGELRSEHCRVAVADG